MTRWDLLVLGGGPAGAATAALAAAAGARVLVAERERFPRHKVCGEFLSAEARPVLEALGVLPELLAAGAVEIDACRVSAPGGATLDAPLPELEGGARAGLGLSRARLDAILLDRARRCGAEVRERVEAFAPVLEAGRVRGACLRRVGEAGGEETVRARVVVAADGRRSMLVRAFHPRRGDPRRSTGSAWFGLKAHFLQGVRPDSRVHLHVFDGGYAGLAAIEGGRLNVCLLATVSALRACGGRPDRLLAERVRRNPAAAEALDGCAPGGRWHSIGPLRFGARLPAAFGVLFVGDAAGTIDPFAGEGMCHALRAASLAAPLALEAAAAGGVNEAIAARYARSWTAAFGAATSRARRLAQLLQHPFLARAAVAALSVMGPPAFARLVAHSRTGARS